MRNKIIILLALVLIFVMCGCQKVVTNEQVNNNFLTVYKLETLSKEDINQKWNKDIEKQLINLGLNEIQIKKQITNSIFEKCRIEYGAEQEYDKSSYPYSVVSDVIIWKSGEFYALCEVNNNEIKSLDNNIEIVKEEPDEMWNESVSLLEVLPINQATLYSIGGRASFKDKQDKVGPFTIVQSFYIACP